MPYPADFGGVLDLFYKLPALQKLGINIHLHCFDYGRGKQIELNKYCVEVNYYKRNTGITGFSLNLPYIVSSRKSKALRDKLAKDNHPILIEGVHCTYLLNDDRFKGRNIVVRLHNVEHIYYHHLYKTTTSLPRKIYSLLESRQLLRYEKSIANKAKFLAVSQKDVADYKKLGCRDVHFLPLFLPDWQVSGREGNGTFCLYHGNLEIAENERAVIWLLEKVFNDLKLPLAIAGKNPGPHLLHFAERLENVCVVANPSDTEMQDMIGKAHLHIIPSFNATGIKLKLINAMYNGRHIVANNATVEGTGLAKGCNVAETANQMKQLIAEMYKQPFTLTDIKNRQQLLEGMFDNETNARHLVKFILKDYAGTVALS